MEAKFRYCGAPAVALGKGHPAEPNITDAEDSQAPAVPAPLGGRLAGDPNYQLFCMRIAFDAQRALDAQRDTEVDAAKAHFLHPLPRNIPRKFVKKVPKVVQSKKNKRSQATPEDLKVKKRRVLEAGAAQGELENCTMFNVVKKVPKIVQTITCEVCNVTLRLNDVREHEKGKRHKMRQFRRLDMLREHERAKHKKNLEKLQDSITSEPAKPPNGAVGASTAPAAAVADGVMPAVQPKNNNSSAASPEDLEAKEEATG